MECGNKQKILEHFDKIFETNIKGKTLLDIPILKLIYERLEEELTIPSEEYEKLRKDHIKLSEKLEASLSKEQWDMFEEHWDLTNQLGAIESEQLFYFGWIMAKALEEDTKIKKE